MARVIVAIPDDFLAQIDETARNQHRSRSELICEALRQYVVSWQTPPATGQSVVTDGEAADIIERLRAQAAARAQQAIDSVEVIRAFRGEL